MAEDWETLTDTELMRRVVAGQAACFAEIVRRYQGPLLRVARSRLGRADWAEEVVQETLMAAFRAARTFDPRFSFRTWLWTIALNECRSHFARRQRRPPCESLPAESAEDQAPAPLERVLAQERSDLLESLLARLNPVQADALRLRFFGGLKFQEIADAMGCSLGSAKNRVRWGLAHLAEWLAPQHTTTSSPATPGQAQERQR